MSKALRIAIDESPISSPPSWHPYYLDMSGNNMPCYAEFVMLMECVKKQSAEKMTISDCLPQYRAFVTCLKKQGFQTPEN